MIMLIIGALAWFAAVVIDSTRDQDKRDIHEYYTRYKNDL